MNVYKFDDLNRSIIIDKYNLPSPWINYLSNGSMHAFVSQAGGGFAWWQDPINYRITRYRMYNLPIDSPGFYIYIRGKNGEFWSPTCRPCDIKPDAWQAEHRPGITTFKAGKDQIDAELSFYMTPDYDSLVWDMTLHNHSGEKTELDVFAYVELSQLVWKQELFAGYYWRHMLKTWHDKNTDSLIYLYHFQFHPEVEKVPLVYFASTEPLSSFSGSRDDFVGAYRDERSPLGVEKNNCGNMELTTGEPCGALHNMISLAAGERRRIKFFLGAIPGALLKYPEAMARLEADLKNLRNRTVLDEQKAKLEQWWTEHLEVFDCTIPDVDAQRQINTWSPVNSVHTGRYSRAVNPSAPGVRGYGFRDSCQDMLAIAYRKPLWAVDMLKFLLSKQYKGGNAVHSIHFLKNEMPDPTLHSDDHLWLPMLLHAILSETGDFSLLDEGVPFLMEDHMTSSEPATIWEHMLAAVNFTETRLGAHKLPLTLHGDWNDLIGKFSRKGRGESVFAGQQYVYVLRKLVEIAEAINDKKNAKWFRDCAARMEKALLENAWDEKWWLRGFDDEGVPVGSKDSVFGKLFLNPQSWSVLSGVGTREQLETCMASVKNNLDTGMGVKKLMPGFETWPDVSDPFTGYGPGCGENGAVFCHANTWVIIAETMLGNGTRAWKYYTQIVPHVALQKVGIDRYQAEPYAWVSNIVGPENKRFGWANVTQVTGTAPWMDVAATQYLLGIRPEINGLRIDPCIPGNWSAFSVRRRFRGCDLNISVHNETGVEKGIKSITVEGIPVSAGDIPVIPAEVLAGRSTADVCVIMGEL